MKSVKMVVLALALVVIAGCSSNPPNYGEYREKIMLCESMNMTVHVVNGIRDNVPYVRDVVCYDKHGATWNTERMND